MGKIDVRAVPSDCGCYFQYFRNSIQLTEIAAFGNPYRDRYFGIRRSDLGRTEYRQLYFKARNSHEYALDYDIDWPSVRQ